MATLLELIDLYQGIFADAKLTPEQIFALKQQNAEMIRLLNIELAKLEAARIQGISSLYEDNLNAIRDIAKQGLASSATLSRANADVQIARMNNQNNMIKALVDSSSSAPTILNRPLAELAGIAAQKGQTLQISKKEGAPDFRGQDQFIDTVIDSVISAPDAIYGEAINIIDGQQGQGRGR